MVSGRQTRVDIMQNPALLDIKKEAVMAFPTHLNIWNKNRVQIYTSQQETSVQQHKDGDD